MSMFSHSGGGPSHLGNGWKPRKPRKQLETGRKAPVNLKLERRIENGRRMGLDAKHKRGERQHARVTTPEFRRGYDGIDWSK